MSPPDLLNGKPHVETFSTLAGRLASLADQLEVASEHEERSRETLARTLDTLTENAGSFHDG